MAAKRLTARQFRALYLVALSGWFNRDGGVSPYSDRIGARFELHAEDYAALLAQGLVQEGLQALGDGIATVRVTNAGIEKLRRNPARLRAQVYTLTTGGEAPLYRAAAVALPDPEAHDYRMPRQGDKVIYLGSLSELHGKATVVGDCGCRDCRRGVGALRFELRTADGTTIEHVFENSFVKDRKGARAA